MFPFISDAYAAANQAAAGEAANPIMQFLPFILIFAVFWFLVIRPQQKKAKAHKELVSSVDKGDQVLTTTGIFGTVEKVFPDKDYIHLEIADKTVIKILREHVADIVKRKDSN